MLRFHETKLKNNLGLTVVYILLYKHVGRDHMKMAKSRCYVNHKEEQMRLNIFKTQKGFQQI